MIPDPYTFNDKYHQGHQNKTYGILVPFMVKTLPVHKSSGAPLRLYGTVGSKDAAVERKGTYLQRVP